MSPLFRLGVVVSYVQSFLLLVSSFFDVFFWAIPSLPMAVTFVMQGLFSILAGLGTSLTHLANFCLTAGGILFMVQRYIFRGKIPSFASYFYVGITSFKIGLVITSLGSMLGVLGLFSVFCAMPFALLSIPFGSWGMRYRLAAYAAIGSSLALTLGLDTAIIQYPFYAPLIQLAVLFVGEMLIGYLCYRVCRLMAGMQARIIKVGVRLVGYIYNHFIGQNLDYRISLAKVEHRALAQRSTPHMFTGSFLDSSHVPVRTLLHTERVPLPRASPERGPCQEDYSPGYVITVELQDTQTFSSLHKLAGDTMAGFPGSRTKYVVSKVTPVLYRGDFSGQHYIYSTVFQHPLTATIPYNAPRSGVYKFFDVYPFSQRISAIDVEVCYSDVYDPWKSILMHQSLEGFCKTMAARLGVDTLIDYRLFVLELQRILTGLCKGSSFAGGSFLYDPLTKGIIASVTEGE